MRESTSSGSVLERYEVPAMRIVPTDGGRIVVESFIGNTSLGVFGGGDAYNWNEASATNGSLGSFTNDAGSGLGWASMDDCGIGSFTTGGDPYNWNEASATGGRLDGFTGTDGLGWASAGGESIGNFETGEGSDLQWSDTP